jgi:hypothetical protein
VKYLARRQHGRHEVCIPDPVLQLSGLAVALERDAIGMDGPQGDRRASPVELDFSDRIAALGGHPVIVSLNKNRALFRVRSHAKQVGYQSPPSRDPSPTWPMTRQGNCATVLRDQ